MADLTITGDSKSAVHAITELKGAIAAANGAAFNMLGTIRSLNKTVEEQGAAVAATESITKAIKNQAEAVRKTTAEYQNQAAEVQAAAAKIRSTLAFKGKLLKFDFDTGQSAQLESSLASLQLKMQSLGIKAAPVNQLFKDLLGGKTPSGLDEKLLTLVPILKSIVQLDNTRSVAIQKTTTKVREQVDAYNQMIAIQARADAGQRTGRVFANITSPNQAGLANASADEINKLNLANQGIADANRKAQLSFVQLRQLAADFATGTKRSFTDSEKTVISAIGRQQTAIRGLGNEHETAQARIARAAQQGADRVTTSYDRANQSIGGLLLSWRSVIRLATIQTLHLAFGRLVSTVFEANRQMSELAVQIALIQTISQKAQFTTDEWANSLVRLSTDKGFDVVEIAAAAYEAISNQVTKGADTFIFLGQALDFARATQTSATDAVNLLSSAINSFGQTTNDTREIASEFFAVIDLGRVKASDLANTFGKVGPEAKQLGLSLGEVGAAIAVLTNVGVKPREVLTELSGIMNKLISPTKEMKQFFNELGVSGDEAAIKTFGLLGVLQKLSDAALAGDSRLGELVGFFNEIRALRGAAFLTSTQGLKEFDEALKNITGRQESYNEAVRVTSQTTTAVIQKSTEEFKNHILLNIVKPFQQFVAEMIKGGTTLTSIFVQIKAATVPVIAGFLGWRIAMAGITTILPALTSLRIVWQDVAAAEARAAAGARGAAEALAQYRTVMNSLRSIAILGATAILTALIVEHQQTIALAEQARDTQKRIVAEILKSEQDTSTKQQSIQENLTTKFKQALDERFRGLRQYAAAVTRLSTAIDKSLEEGFKESFERSKDIVQDFISSLNDNLSTIKNTLSSVKSTLTHAISESAKDQTDFARKQFDAFIANMEDIGGDPSKLISAIKERQDTLQKAAQAAAAKTINPDGTVNEDAHADARRAVEEMAQLQQKIADILKDQAKNASPSKQDQVRKILEQMIGPAGEFASIQKLQNQLQDDYIAKLKIVQARKEKERDLQNEILDKVKAQFKVLEATVSKKAETPEEQKKKFDETTTQVGDIFKTLTGAGLSLDSATKVFGAFQDNLKIQQQQILKTQTDTKINESKQAINTLQQKQEEAAKRQTDVLNKNQEVNKQVADHISEFTKAIPDRIGSFTNDQNPGINFGLGIRDKGDKLLIGDLAKQIVQAGVSRNFTAVQGEQDGKESGRAIVDVSAITRTLQTASEAVKNAPNANNIKLLTDTLNDMKIVLGVLNGNANSPDIANLVNEFAVVQRDAAKIVDNARRDIAARQELQNITAALTQAKQNFENEIRFLDAQTQRDIKETDARQKMIELLIEANKYLSTLAGAPRKAAGGWISGGRPGYDSVPIMAMPGEFIVNARDAQRNAGLLTAMNSGNIRGFARGGFVSRAAGSAAGSSSYDFSGMSIVVQGGSNSRETALEIGKILEREVRRGTIDFG